MIINVENTIVFLIRKVIFAEKPQLKINNLKKKKHWYLIHTWSDKSFDGTIVNGALSNLNEGLHEITLQSL